jgi:hypothetical protein
VLYKAVSNGITAAVVGFFSTALSRAVQRLALNSLTNQGYMIKAGWQKCRMAFPLMQNVEERSSNVTALLVGMFSAAAKIFVILQAAPVSVHFSPEHRDPSYAIGLFL